MEIATLLFTYHRSYHTGKVLKALKENTIAPQKLLVFQDGLKPDEDGGEWKKVNQLIKSIDWCDTEIIVSNYNKGLADSIVSGITYAFQRYDAVIVLEDDCVASPCYMQFMIQGLEKYKEMKRIYSVSGYGWPIFLDKDQFDAYSCGRVSTLGWGTWKDRWKDFKKDTDILKRIKTDPVKSKNLLTWGKDLEVMLAETIRGQCDSWGVYWALNVIENNGICINPYISLIEYIGWDDTATNTKPAGAYEIVVSNVCVKGFVFPDNISILDGIKKAFAGFYGSYTATSQVDSSKENVLVYGLGNFYLQYEKSINDTYNIKAFVDTKKHGWYADRKIIAIDQIGHYSYDKIIVMVMDIQECINIIRDLVKHGISPEKIVLGNSLYKDQNIDKLSILYTADEVKLEVTMKGVTVKVRSKDEFCNAYESLISQIWNYTINNGKEDIILDVGMNVGDTSLYFLHHKKVKKVYGFEPFRQPYSDAEDNLKDYMQNTERIEIFQYGISNENGSRVIDFNKDMTCGQSTIASVREEAYEWYRNEGLVQIENEEKESIQVRDAKEVFFPIIQKHSDCNIVLKMNCEGEEYNIMKRLSETDLIDKITVIMLEWHYKGKEEILRHLDKAGFTYWCNDKDHNMGLIYASRI